MSVFVDDMRAPFGRMLMCHMIADTSAELHAMAERLGLQRRWCQQIATAREHYDVSLMKRRLAIGHGAIEISQRELSQRVFTRGRGRLKTSADDSRNLGG